jgi:hypothetical protein
MQVVLIKEFGVERWIEFQILEPGSQCGAQNPSLATNGVQDDDLVHNELNSRLTLSWRCRNNNA